MNKTKAEILTIGDEILYGQLLDTNSQWMSAELDKIGIKTIRKTTVGDTREDILTAFKEAEARVDIVLITGGLGPTNDDLTKPCLAEYFGCEIAMNEAALQEVSNFFASKGLELTEVNRLQAALPVCCDMVSNKLGTAPGMWFERNGKVFVSMPGVPHEMKKMMTDTVIPQLQQVFQTDIIFHKIIKTIGIGESWLAEMIKDWEDSLPEHIKLAYLPSMGQVKLRLTAIGDNLDKLKVEVESLIQDLHKLAGKYIYGYDTDQIEEVVGKMLLDQHKTIALAESCTGGYVSHKITSIAGSSQYYQGSVIPYHNSLKIDILGVNEQTLLDHGAVSEQTVYEMANLVRKRFNADIGVATSGIAGPGGGTPDKPVGTVWIAYADGEQTITRKLQLWKDRDINIQATAVALLNLIRISLSKSIEIKQ
ncbi:competence/damage-inducible protein A [Fulvivirga kasyanovii]|uniref:CinA-like protein n=1 Tax=Fulvivirga kasyanovii TaxID=396812 RepID=A0ABW9RK30_9BACT|nr:competence/damage-inducible protein A [Fulvivirga kasyanovii]MTI24452.1 competence/damage-inducible protein A [Fulvivirga kasyanovii]